MDLYPHRKDFGGDRFAYVVPLTFGRGRVCVTTLGDPWSVHDGW